MQQQVKISGFTGAMRGTALQQRAGASRPAAAARQAVQAATQQITTRKLKASQVKTPPPPPRKTVAGTTSKTVAGTASKKAVGTMSIRGTKTVSGTTSKTVAGTKSVGTRKVTAIEVFSKEKQFRQKQQGDSKPAPKILSRIEQLKLLSKLEQSGLLSQLEKSGVTLSKLEQSGLLSTAEKFGAVSLLADRNVPSTLFALATALLVAGPTSVYFLPDDSAGLVALQVVIAITCIAGGSAAWAGASALSTLQK